MKVYVVEIYDDLLEDGAIYGRAYLTRSAAQKRADRATGEEDGVKTWARVCELEVAGEPVVGRETCHDVCEPPKSGMLH